MRMHVTQAQTNNSRCLGRRRPPTRADTMRRRRWRGLGTVELFGKGCRRLDRSRVLCLCFRKRVPTWYVKEWQVQTCGHVCICRGCIHGRSMDCLMCVLCSIREKTNVSSCINVCTHAWGHRSATTAKIGGCGGGEGRRRHQRTLGPRLSRQSLPHRCPTPAGGLSLKLAFRTGMQVGGEEVC